MKKGGQTEVRRDGKTGSIHFHSYLQEHCLSDWPIRIGGVHTAESESCILTVQAIHRTRQFRIDAATKERSL